MAPHFDLLSPPSRLKTRREIFELVRQLNHRKKSDAESAWVNRCLGALLGFWFCLLFRWAALSLLVPFHQPRFFLMFGSGHKQFRQDSNVIGYTRLYRECRAQNKDHRTQFEI